MLRLLDSCIQDRDDLQRLRSSLEKIEKICSAVSRGAHFADLVSDPEVIQSLRKSFGDAEFATGLQLLSRVALGDFSTRSFTLVRDIDSQKKLEFIYRSLGGWKQFQFVISFQLPDGNIAFIQPQKSADWKELGSLPAGTLVSAYIRTGNGAKRSAQQEDLALERCALIFDTIQDRASTFDVQPAPTVAREVPAKAAKAAPVAATQAAAAAPKEKATAAAKPAAKVTSLPRKSFTKTPPRVWGKSNAAPSGPPTFTLRVVINKMDTFVHAGNAHLILQHLRDYSGKVIFAVLRGERKNVQLDADSMWGAEIRNGETVVFDFHGEVPADDFIKELAKKVNKYTQMDKVANE